MTALSGHEPVLLVAILRLGTHGNPRDNWSAGDISIGIELEQGVLKKEGFYQLRPGGRTGCHPDAKVTFRDYEVPFCKETVQMVKRLHTFFYGLHSVGWNIAIADQGSTISEANDNWGLPIVQTHDNHFKRNDLEVLEQPCVKR